MVFYSTPLFVSLGLGQDSAFLSSVITGVVFVAATVVAVFTVDRYGRRVRACLGSRPCRPRSRAQTRSPVLLAPGSAGVHAVLWLKSLPVGSRPSPNEEGCGVHPPLCCRGAA